MAYWRTKYKDQDKLRHFKPNRCNHLNVLLSKQKEFDTVCTDCDAAVIEVISASPRYKERD